VHRTFQRWVALGLFDRLWALVQQLCEELDGCDWSWQAADTSMGKARSGGTSSVPIPTDRAKPGVKRSLLVEADGGPLAVVVAGANVPDAYLLAATIEAVVLERPPAEAGWSAQHLCLDRGYDTPIGWRVCLEHGYVPHIARIRDARPSGPKGHRARRWVVERSLAWLSKCRALLIRWDKKASNYLGLLKLACALLWFRRYHRLAGLRWFLSNVGPTGLAWVPRAHGRGLVTARLRHATIGGRPSARGGVSVAMWGQLTRRSCGQGRRIAGA